MHNPRVSRLDGHSVVQSATGGDHPWSTGMSFQSSGLRALTPTLRVVNRSRPAGIRTGVRPLRFTWSAPPQPNYHPFRVRAPPLSVHQPHRVSRGLKVSLVEFPPLRFLRSR